MTKEPHSRLFSHYPLTQLAVAYSTGVLLASGFAFQTRWFLLTTGVCTLATAFTLVFQRLVFAHICLLVAFTSAGASLFVIQNTSAREGSLKLLFTEGVISDQTSVIVRG
jgi:hypothetical protein